MNREGGMSSGGMCTGILRASTASQIDSSYRLVHVKPESSCPMAPMPGSSFMHQ